jgi:hypothetical protein
MINQGKTYIMTGHYGSGKTEFCVNFVLEMHKKNPAQKVYIADLDVINPYFRSREKAEDLTDFNIEIMGCVFANSSWQDFPALSYGFLSKVKAKENVIIDLAGSDNGLKPLETCYPAISQVDYEFLCVVNIFRNDTSTTEKIIKFTKNINEMSKLSLTGLVNNSNLLHETTAEHIIMSQEIVAAASKATNLPIKYTQIRSDLYPQVKDQLITENVLLFDKLQMREDWQ